MHEVLAGMSKEAALEIAERLEDDDMREKMPLASLLEIVKVGADRSGHGPSSSSTQVNVNVNLASRLEEARKRVAERRTLELVVNKDPLE
jgi:hypothetical protein